MYATLCKPYYFYYSAVSRVPEAYVVVIRVRVFPHFSMRQLNSKCWKVIYNLLNFNLPDALFKALSVSYSMICSPQQPFPAIQSQAKTNSPIADCLLTWLFHLYNKSGGDLSETQRTRMLKLHHRPTRLLVPFNMPNNCTVFTLSFPVGNCTNSCLVDLSAYM